MKKLTQLDSGKFSGLELKTHKMRQVKGGGWGNGNKEEFKNCPPPNSGLWKRHDMSDF